MILNRESIRQIIAVLAASNRQTDTNKILSCNQYTIEDCELYLDGQMVEEMTHAFESHCANCLSCLEKLYQSDVELSPEQEKKENEYLLLKTNKFLDHLDQKNNDNILELLIKVVDKAVKLISTTGLVVKNPQPASVRSTGKIEQVIRPPIRIVQESRDSPYSLQATITSKDGSIISLSVSVFNRDNEEFTEGVNATLKTPTIEKNQFSDLNGEVTFQITGTGVHELTLTTDKEFVGKILLTIS